ncbi:uncharacterized protein LOC116601981 [Nematostella vectensis]|uniref:uncharacterized protein LOC116601981 n=1 Tax=Nematostella vectensis TaxID=45351 RepID=UPI00138FD7CA|nr:uncharacterized protein LOC116601981 [Nematostella vectensis]
MSSPKPSSSRPEINSGLSSAKKKTKRSKEKYCYIEDSKRRAITLSKRKATLFQNFMKLNIMSGADAFMIIETPRKRFVWGSDKYMKLYTSAKLRPTLHQEIVDLTDTSTSEEVQNAELSSMGVAPLEDTPHRVNMHESLANVLGVANKTLPPKAIIPDAVAGVLNESPPAQVLEQDVPLQRLHPPVELTYVQDSDIPLLFIGQEIERD